MMNWKNILIHDLPVVIVSLGAIFGLDADESNTLSQLITTIISAGFGVAAIYMHHRKPKDKPPKHLPVNGSPTK